MQFHYLSLILTKALNPFLLQPPQSSSHITRIALESSNLFLFPYWIGLNRNQRWLHQEPQPRTSSLCVAPLPLSASSLVCNSLIQALLISFFHFECQFLCWVAEKSLTDLCILFFFAIFSIRLFSKQVIGMGSLSLFLLFMLSIGVCPILGLWICNLETNFVWKLGIFNSILYNRGVYPEESFVKVKKYGLPMLLTQDEGLKSFLATLTSQLSGMVFSFWVCLGLILKQLYSSQLHYWVRMLFLGTHILYF